MPAPKITNIFWLVFGIALIVATGFAGHWAGPDIPKTLPRDSNSVDCSGFPAPKIVAFELAGTADSARPLSFPTAAGGHVRTCENQLLTESLRRDSLFILAYVFTIGWFCTWGARRFRSTKLRALGWMAIAITIVAAALDVVENVFLAAVLNGHFEQARYATAASLAKWALLVVPVAYALGALFTLVTRWFAHDPVPLEHPCDDPWQNTQLAPDRLRAVRGTTLLASQDRWWWASRPPFPGAWETRTPENDDVLGIAFSGGGIRSASFHLGVLERLHQPITVPAPGVANVIERARYLASVSGGGYVAAARQFTLHQANATTPPGVPPLATNAFAGNTPEQRFVEKRRLYLWDTMWLRALGMGKVFLGIGINLALFGALLYIAARPIGWFAGSYVFRSRFGLGNAAALWLTAAALAAAAFAGYLARKLDSVVGHGARAFATCCGVASGVLVLVGLATISDGRSVAIVIGATFAIAGVGSFTAWRAHRPIITGCFFTGIGAVLAAIAVLLTRLWIRGAAVHRLDRPAVLDARWLQILAVFVLLYVTATAVVYFLVEHCPPRGVPGGACAVVGAVLTWLGWRTAGWFGGEWDVRELVVWGVWVVLLGFVLCFVDQRLWSPHVFYKKRLLHTFSPIRPDRDPGGAACDEDMQLAMSVTTDLETWAQPVAGQPELLVCAAVHLPGTTFGHRPAGSFTFSHAMVGGPDVGWIPTHEFRASLRKRMVKDGTLGAATAISGAAIAAANGYMRIGGANSALALLNARLGVWLPNPTHVHELQGRRPPEEGGTGVWIGHRNIGYSLKEVFGIYDPLDRFVYVSDGGHHDNLGLIELLRRRCRVVVCFDASGDAPGSVNTFVEVQLRAYLELGVIITPTCEHEDDALKHGSARVAVYKVAYPALPCPVGVAKKKCKTPSEDPCEEDCDDEPPEPEDPLPAQEGWLIFAKCALLEPGGETFPCSEEATGDFPHDSTAHQWFSEKRLDQYRALGAEIASEAITRLAGL